MRSLRNRFGKFGICDCRSSISAISIFLCSSIARDVWVVVFQTLIIRISVWSHKQYKTRRVVLSTTLPPAISCQGRWQWSLSQTLFNVNGTLFIVNRDYTKSESEGPTRPGGRVHSQPRTSRYEELFSPCSDQLAQRESTPKKSAT